MTRTLQNEKRKNPIQEICLSKVSQAERRRKEKCYMDTNIQTQMFRYKFGYKCSEQVDTRGPYMHQITLDSFFVRTSMSETCYVQDSQFSETFVRREKKAI